MVIEIYRFFFVKLPEIAEIGLSERMWEGVLTVMEVIDMIAIRFN